MDTSELETGVEPKRVDSQNGDSHKPIVTLEEAIAQTQHGKFHTLLLFGCGCCMIAMVAEVFGTAFITPAAQCEFQMGASEKGLLNAISYIGMIMSSHMWGYLADTKGRRRILIMSLLFDIVCGVLSSFAPSLYLFIVFRFFNGFFMCAPSAVVIAYLGEFHSSATRTRVIILMSVFLSVGGLIQQVMAWVMIPQSWILEVPLININYGPWRVFVLTNVLSSVVAAIFIFLLPESPKYLFSMGKDEDALGVLQKMYSINTGRQPGEYPVTHVTLSDNEAEAVGKAKPKSVIEVVKSMWSQTVPLFQKPNRLITTLAFTMQFIFYASFNGFAMWTPDIYSRIAQYGEKHPNSSLTICQVVEALKQVVTTNPLQRLEPVLNTTIDSIAFDRLDNSTLSNTSIYVVESHQADLICTSEVDPTVYRNMVVIGCVCTITYTCAGIIVKYVEKKPLMAVCLLISSAAAASLYFAPTEWLIMSLVAVFIATSGTCVNMLNSIVIDCIPTHLRAMAVCLSMMSGRFGVTACSLLIGALLETTCAAVFAILSGIVLFCCFLTFLIPKPPKS